MPGPSVFPSGEPGVSCQSGGAPALRPGAIAQSPGREAALAWAEDPPGEGNGNPLQYSCLENPMDCSPPGSPVHGTLKARILGPNYFAQIALRTFRPILTLRDTARAALPCPAPRLLMPCAGVCPRASSTKTRGFHTQLDEGPETP